MRSVLVLVVALALTNAFNLKAFLNKEIGDIEKYLEAEPLGDSKIPDSCMSNPAITIKQLDISPYPPTRGQNVTVTVDAVGNFETTIKKIVVKAKVLFAYIEVYSQEVDAAVTVGEIKNTTTITVPSDGVPSISNQQIKIEAEDANGNTEYCGTIKVSLNALAPELEAQVNAGPVITKCEDVDYEVGLKSFSVSPYPIQKGHPAKIDAVGVSKDNVDVSDLAVTYAGATIVDIKVDKQCAAGQDCEFTDSEDIPYIPLIETATLTANVNDANGKNLACYKVQVKFEDTFADKF